MCGLLGFASSEKYLKVTKQKFLTTGFPLLAVDRGMESSGLALIEEANREPIIYKKALCGWDFLQQFQIQKYLDNIDKYQIGLGHVRASTRGNVCDYNAHPFQYGHITLVHNGHIRNAHQLKGSDQAQSAVDSAVVAHSMAVNGEMETLSEVEGGFVFIWWNSKTQKLNIARNSERPLFFAYIKNENSMYWASELTHLLHLLRNATIDEDVGHLYPGAMIWYQFDIANLRGFEKVPFASSQGRQKLWTGSGGTGAGRTGGTHQGWTDAELEKMSNPQLPTTSKGTDYAYLRSSLNHQRLKDVKLSGMPTSPKRKARAKDELNKLGFKFMDVVACKPISWHAYKNQKGLGSMMCQMREKGAHWVEVINIRDTQYAVHMANKLILVDCVNVKTTGKNCKRIIGVVPEMESTVKVKQEDTNATKESLGSIDRDYDGPGGQKISRARFLELVVDGCGNCRRTISDKEHGTVVWVGSPPSPVCHDCNGTPEVMEAIGFPEHLKSSIH